MRIAMGCDNVGEPLAKYQAFGRRSATTPIRLNDHARVTTRKF